MALVARSEDGLAETAEAIDALGRKAVVIPADVTSQEAVAKRRSPRRSTSSGTWTWW